MPPESFGSSYYDTVYRHYKKQNPPYKYQFYNEFIAKHAGKGRGRILDVGCAFGGFLTSYRTDWDRFGIDISSHAIAQAQKDRPDLTLAAATLETNPFAGLFDVVTSFDVIEHIPDLTVVSEAVYSLLKPGGKFIFVVPVYDGPLGPVVHLLDKDPTHLHKTSRHFWLDWAEKHFSVLEWMGIYRILLPTGHYVHYPTKMFPAFSPAIIVAARRRP